MFICITKNKIQNKLCCYILNYILCSYKRKTRFYVKKGVIRLKFSNVFRYYKFEEFTCEI